MQQHYVHKVDTYGGDMYMLCWAVGMPDTYLVNVQLSSQTETPNYKYKHMF